MPSVQSAGQIIGTGPRVERELLDFPAAERVERFRRLAVEARRLAGEVNGNEFREAYLRIASRWEVLAENLERTLVGHGKD